MRITYDYSWKPTKLSKYLDKKVQQKTEDRKRYYFGNDFFTRFRFFGGEDTGVLSIVWTICSVLFRFFAFLTSGVMYALRLFLCLNLLSIFCADNWIEKVFIKPLTNFFESLPRRLFLSSALHTVWCVLSVILSDASGCNPFLISS